MTAEKSPMGVSGTPYIWVFSHNLDPRRLAVSCEVCGAAVPDAFSEFSYVDVGCGRGLTLVMLAQALPWGNFLGLDINPEHIASGREMAAHLGLQNISFRQNDMSNLNPGDLPQADFLVANGIYSWVSEAERRALWSLARQFLAPRGVFQLGYNVTAGWEALSTTRALIVSAIEAGIAPREAVMRVFEQFSSHFAGTNPTLSRRLAGLLNLNPAYLIHEFSSKDWKHVSTSELVAEGEREGFHCAGPYLSPQPDTPRPERLLQIDDPLFWKDYFNARTRRAYRWANFQKEQFVGGGHNVSQARYTLNDSQQAFTVQPMQPLQNNMVDAGRRADLVAIVERTETLMANPNPVQDLEFGQVVLRQLEASGAVGSASSALVLPENGVMVPVTAADRSVLLGQLPEVQPRSDAELFDLLTHLRAGGAVRGDAPGD